MSRENRHSRLMIWRLARRLALRHDQPGSNWKRIAARALRGGLPCPIFGLFVSTFSSELRNRRYRHQLASLRASKGCLLWSQLRSGGRRGRARGPFAARQRRASARRCSSERDRPSPRPGRPRAARGPHDRACPRRSARVLFKLSPASRRPTAAAPRSIGAAPRLSVVDKPCFEPTQPFKRPRDRPRRASTTTRLPSLASLIASLLSLQ